jgi:hypothetical protein
MAWGRAGDFYSESRGVAEMLLTTKLQAAQRMQADALEIETAAKRRLADEYDAAQERGEVARHGRRTDLLPDEKESPDASRYRAQLQAGARGASGARRRDGRSRHRARTLGHLFDRGEEPGAAPGTLGMHGPCDRSASLRL